MHNPDIRAAEGQSNIITRSYVMAKCVFTCFQILKPTMNKWAQYPAQKEA